MSPLRSSAARGLDERHAELGRDDLGERGLAEPGRSGQQHVVECVPARLAASIATASCSLSCCCPTNSSSRRGRSVRSNSSSAARYGGLDALRLGAHARTSRTNRRSCCLLSAARDQLLDRLPGGVRRAARSASEATKPRFEAARRGHQSRGASSALAYRRTTIPSPIVPPTLSRSSTMIRSAVRLPTPGHRLEEARRHPPRSRPPRRSAGPPPGPRARASARPPAHPAGPGRGPAPPPARSPRAPSASSRTIRCVWSVDLTADGGRRRRSVCVETASR